MYCFMHMRGKTVCKFSVKMKIQVVSIFSKTNRLLYSTTTLESTFRGITVGLALARSRYLIVARDPYLEVATVAIPYSVQYLSLLLYTCARTMQYCTVWHAGCFRHVDVDKATYVDESSREPRAESRVAYLGTGTVHGT